MAKLDLGPQGPVFDRRVRLAIAAIGLFDESEFARARMKFADLAIYSDYQDWLDSREGLQIGLSMAGVEAKIVRVRLASFLRWRALAGAACVEPALDAFARLAMTVKDDRRSKIFAVVSEADFAQRRFAAGAHFGRADFNRWVKHRDRLRASAVALGLSVGEQPVRLSEFFEWCDCLGLRAAEPALDRYARLLLEHLASE